MFDIRKFIITWDNLFQVDLWWRKRYNVPYNSKKHRSTSYIAMVFEYIEWVELTIASRTAFAQKTGINELDSYFDESKDVKMSQKDIQSEFENLDIDKYADSTKTN